MGFAHCMRENLKEKCLQYLGGKVCYRCEVNSLPYACYDFHHVMLKNENISKLCGSSVSWEELKKELDKCVILCANCHREVHYFRIIIRKEKEVVCQTH